MKKHPVDDLFRGKLAGLEKRPSSAAWEKIASEQKKPNRKLAMWVWYAAAGILVAFMAGYLTWQSSQQISVEKQIAKVSEPKRAVMDTPMDEVKPVNPAIESDKKPIGQELATAVKPGKQTVFNKNNVKIETANEVELAKSNVNVEVQKNNSPKVEQIASLPVNEKKVELAETVSPVIKSQISNESLVAVKEVKDENRLIIVNVEMPENASGEKGKTSRFAKVFRQLKNARAGERVDWEEVGFNPKDVLAKVDGRGRNRDEENLEKNTKRTKL